MDNVDGDFQFDLARIRAVNVVRGEVMEKDDEEEKGEGGDGSASRRYATLCIRDA